MTTNELINLFFSELKKYNSSNFKTLEKADLSKDGDSPMVRKSFSSVITRYFIFREKHPEINDVDNKILYYKLRLDQVAKYFSEYPETSTDNLVGFQVELRNYVKEHKDTQSETQLEVETA
jgi:hypothetical protein